MSGKGSRPRPFSVDLDTYAANYAAIFRKPMDAKPEYDVAEKLSQYDEIIRESLETIVKNAKERGDS